MNGFFARCRMAVLLLSCILASDGCKEPDQMPDEIRIVLAEGERFGSIPPMQELEWGAFDSTVNDSGGVLRFEGGVGPASDTVYAFRSVYKRDSGTPELPFYYYFAGRDVMDASDASRLAQSILAAAGRPLDDARAAELRELVRGIAEREVSDGAASLSIFSNLDEPDGISLDLSRQPRGRAVVTLDLYLRISDPDPLW